MQLEQSYDDHMPAGCIIGPSERDNLTHASTIYTLHSSSTIQVLKYTIVPYLLDQVRSIHYNNANLPILTERSKDFVFPLNRSAAGYESSAAFPFNQ